MPRASPALSLLHVPKDKTIAPRVTDTWKNTDKEPRENLHVLSEKNNCISHRAVAEASERPTKDRVKVSTREEIKKQCTARGQRGKINSISTDPQ
jgi:hypothetical protein